MNTTIKTNYQQVYKCTFFLTSSIQRNQTFFAYKKNKKIRYNVICNRFK